MSSVIISNAVDRIEDRIVGGMSEVMFGGLAIARLQYNIYETHVSVASLEVAPKYQKMNIGTLLMTWFILWARLNGHRCIRLSVVEWHSRRERLVRWYETFGFTFEYDEFGYYNGTLFINQEDI